MDWIVELYVVICNLYNVCFILVYYYFNEVLIIVLNVKEIIVMDNFSVIFM